MPNRGKLVGRVTWKLWSYWPSSSSYTKFYPPTHWGIPLCVGGANNSNSLNKMLWAVNTGFPEFSGLRIWNWWWEFSKYFPRTKRHSVGYRSPLSPISKCLWDCVRTKAAELVNGFFGSCGQNGKWEGVILVQWSKPVFCWWMLLSGTWHSRENELSIGSGWKLRLEESKGKGKITIRRTNM